MVSGDGSMRRANLRGPEVASIGWCSHGAGTGVGMQAHGNRDGIFSRHGDDGGGKRVWLTNADCIGSRDGLFRRWRHAFGSGGPANGKRQADTRGPDLDGLLAAAALGSLIAGTASLAWPALALPAALGALAAGWGAARHGRSPVPETGGLHVEGSHFIGNEVRGGREAWLNPSTLRRHVTVMGDPCPTRDDVLDGFACNAIAQGSGCLLAVTGDHERRYGRIERLANLCGRLDDLLVLDLTGGCDMDVPASDTFNPFASGAADVLTQMVVSVADWSDEDGGLWVGKATGLFTGLMRALVFKRNQGTLDLDAGTVRDHLGLREVIDLADEAKHPDLPKNIRLTVRSYLGSVPGYRPEDGHGQAQDVLDFHGHLQARFTKALGPLADARGHVFLTQAPDVDMLDVVLNRRILVVLLPRMGKARDEASLFGRVVVASLKRAMGSSLGNCVEGGWLEVPDRRMSVGETPFVAVLDDVGHYKVAGMDLMAAQARALGIVLVSGARDAEGLERFDDKVTGSIVANASTHVMTTMGDPRMAAAAVRMAALAYRPMSLEATGDYGSGREGSAERARAACGMPQGVALVTGSGPDRMVRPMSTDVGHVPGGRPARPVLIDPRPSTECDTDARRHA